MTDAYKLTGENKWKNRIIGYDDVPPDQLLANPNNFRVHPKFQQDALAGVLEEIGWLQTVIVNVTTGNMIDGHLRVQLAMRNEEPSVPVTMVELTEAEEKLALATFDPITAMAATDAEILDGLLRDVQTGDEHLQAMLSELAEEAGLYFGENGHEEADAEPEVDRASELRDKWGVELGQLWALGEHRLICDDATDAAVVERLLDGDEIQLMVTDPPYGVEYDSEWRKPYSSGDYSVGTIQNDDRADWGEVWELWKPPVLYVWHGGLHAHVVAESLIRTGYELRGQIIWNKSVMVFGRGHYHWKHEPCWYAVRKGATANWVGDRSQTTVWDYGNNSGAGRTDDEYDDFHANHISQKPVELIRIPIRNHTNQGDIVADAFVGSGTTIVACENLGRRARAADVDPNFVAATLQRYYDAFGITPELVSE